MRGAHRRKMKQEEPFSSSTSHVYAPVKRADNPVNTDTHTHTHMTCIRVTRIRADR